MKLSEDEKIELAHSTHAGMLHDDERHQKYHQALKQVANELKSEINELYALDIGGGTGILSMMAIEAGCNLVTTCEACRPTALVSQKVIKTNKLDQQISIVCKSSHDLEIPLDMPEKADLLVTEIFDSELIGEGVLPTLRDAHERLLNDGARVIPSMAHINIQMIESDLLWSTGQVKFKELGIMYPPSFNNCRGWAAGHEVQIDQLYPEHVKVLSPPARLTSFDFTKPFYHEPTSDGRKYSSAQTVVAVSSAGLLHGLVFWWDLILHKEITLSMKPGWLRDKEESVWREHWMPVLYYLPTPLKVEESDYLHVTMFHDDYSVWFDIAYATVDPTIPIGARDKTVCQSSRYIDRPLCYCGLHLTCPREKFSMLNDRDMRFYYSKVVFQCKEVKMNVAVVGDMSILGLLLSRHGLNNIIYVESNPCVRDARRNVFKCSKYAEKIEILGWDSTDLVKVAASELVICEPYFSSSLLPWQNLRVWKHIKSIRMLNSSVKIFPQKAVLKACTVLFKDLWKIREPVRNIGMFDLTDYDEMVASVTAPLHIEGHGSYQAAEPQFMWEYEHEIKSDVTVLKEFDLSKSPPSGYLSFKGTMKDIGSNSNAVILWMDFEVMEGCHFCTGLNERQEWVFYSKQGIYFLNNLIDNETRVLDYNILLDPEEFEIVFSFISPG